MNSKRIWTILIVSIIGNFTGGNYFVPDIIPTFYPGEADPAALNDAKLRAISMLQLAATLELTPTTSNGYPAVEVKLINETGHKLPSGYPEGRRIWINVIAYDGANEVVYESGAYDASTGVLTHDADLKIYERSIKVKIEGLIQPNGFACKIVIKKGFRSQNMVPIIGTELYCEYFAGPINFESQSHSVLARG